MQFVAKSARETRQPAAHCGLYGAERLLNGKRIVPLLGMTYHLGIIGGGNMGGAIVRGGVRAGVLHASNIIVADIDQARLKQFESLGCAVTTDASAAASAEQIMLAVKPQAFPAV